MSAGLDELLDELLAEKPALRAALADIDVDARRVVDAVDPQLLDLCRDRMSSLLGLHERAPARPASALQQVCVDLVEQMVLDVTGVTDRLVADVAAHLGADGTASFVHAALVIEQRLRMHAMWRRLGLDGAA